MPAFSKFIPVVISGALLMICQTASAIPGIENLDFTGTATPHRRWHSTRGSRRRPYRHAPRASAQTSLADLPCPRAPLALLRRSQSNAFCRDVAQQGGIGIVFRLLPFVFPDG